MPGGGTTTTTTTEVAQRMTASPKSPPGSDVGTPPVRAEAPADSNRQAQEEDDTKKASERSPRCCIPGILLVEALPPCLLGRLSGNFLGHTRLLLGVRVFLFCSRVQREGQFRPTVQATHTFLCARPSS